MPRTRREFLALTVGGIMASSCTTAPRPAGPYTIDNVSGFEGLRFTASSDEYLDLPESVAYATARGGVLQSAREAWAFRIDRNGALDSDQYQSTRTAALGVKIDGRYYIAIDDSEDPATNILLARPQEGYDAHYRTGKWLVQKSDPTITKMLDRAAQGKTVAALDDTLILATENRNGRSAYGAHPIPQAILGNDLAEPVATYLRGKNWPEGFVRTLSPSRLEKLGVDNDHVEVRCVGVGGGVGNYLDAVDRCYDVGRVRGVVRNTSIGDNG
jgi:frataxin-like iron-binding protein CyaY